MDRLADLLEEWEERRDAGRPATPAELCPDDPVLRARLADRVRLLVECDVLLDDLAGRDEGTTADWVPAPHPPVPVRVGRYEIRGVLGGGGFGVVYDGWDPPPAKRRVAVKTLRPDRLWAAGRSHREVEALARLDHPNVVPVHDYGVQDGVPYLVMKYVPGGTLADHRQRLTKAGPRAIVPLVEKIARAVEYAHTHPEGAVLHRDLKPGNVLLGDQDEPLVADFGLARLIAPAPEPGGPADAPPAAPDADTELGSAGLTVPGGRAGGTPPYMAPEQYDPRFGEVGPGTDVWALGVILFELLTGDRPFPGRKYGEVMPRVTRDPAPPLKGFGGRLAAVVARCLEKDPARRFRSAGELAGALAATRGVSRRAVLLSAAAALAVGVPAGVWASDPDLRYRWRTDRLTRRLAAGDAVDLVTPGGPPPAFLLPCGRGFTQTGVTDEGWRIESTKLSVLELLSELPDRPIHVHLEIRHDDQMYPTDPHEGVGLMFGRADAVVEGHTMHFVSRAAFDDRSSRQGTFDIGSFWPLGNFPPEQGAPFGLRSIGAEGSPRFFDAPLPPDFRTIDLTVSPAGVQVIWGGPPEEKFPPLAAAVILDHIDLLRDRRPAEVVDQLRSRYRFRVGLFVSGGRVTVRTLRAGPPGGRVA
ncbi:MAG: serine/threonine protein kinase [Gemmataceae bacterium]|nr:serine/threonine protein kinase [Gemmataceae bacterium]